MTAKENKNFISVEEFYMPLTIEELEALVPETVHMKNERNKRKTLALNLNKFRDGKEAKISKSFLVDKGHPAGKEIHVITKKGIIFILNEQKFKNNLNSFITVLIGRPNQVRRLYESCGLNVPQGIIHKCMNHQQRGFNEM